MPNRKRPTLKLTLAPETLARLQCYALVSGLSRSELVDRLVALPICPLCGVRGDGGPCELCLDIV